MEQTPRHYNISNTPLVQTARHIDNLGNKFQHTPGLGRIQVVGWGDGGGRPPFWGQKRFYPVSLFWKLIKLELLYLKVFCSSKIVDFTPIFLKISAAQALKNPLFPGSPPPPFFEC